MLTPEQMECVQLWVNRKALGIKQSDLARQFNVSERSIRRWIALPEARDYAKELAIELAREALPEIMQVLVKKALEGKQAKWMELALKATHVIGSDSSVNVKVGTNDKEDNRSNEQIEAELEELRKLLDENDEYDRDRNLKLVEGGQD